MASGRLDVEGLRLGTRRVHCTPLEILIFGLVFGVLRLLLANGLEGLRSVDRFSGSCDGS
jgi:hypothetical protein